MFVTLIGCRKDSDQLSICKLLYSVHYTLMCSDYIFKVILLTKAFYPIRTEFDNVSGLIRITNMVGLNAFVFVRVGRVTPENVDHQQVLLTLDFVYHFQRALEFVDVTHLVQRGPDAPVQAEYPVVDDCSHRQLFKHSIH